ncbi:hypothetical protein IQ250_02340 [Pseudanabaenaceae cyanobacterium LEGE 13415]|nr:hypothetical protein [Pseudanabaenaceae cyanobacterium LEGE 13415]
MQTRSYKSVSKFLALSALSLSIACSGSIPLILSTPTIVHAQTRQQSVDSVLF